VGHLKLSSALANSHTGLLQWELVPFCIGLKATCFVALRVCLIMEGCCTHLDEW